MQISRRLQPQDEAVASALASGYQGIPEVTVGPTGSVTVRRLAQGGSLTQTFSSIGEWKKQEQRELEADAQRQLLEQARRTDALRSRAQAIAAADRAKVSGMWEGIFHRDLQAAGRIFDPMARQTVTEQAHSVFQERMRQTESNYELQVHELMRRGNF